MSRTTRRFYRSLLLILLALAILVWIVFDQFDVPPEAVLAMVLGAVSMVGVTIIVAAVGVGLWIIVRKLTESDDSQ
ncbi:MAG: hypothetical protein HRT77_14335 [Halioglobus sp.]|nr:hypothetical protein [Halioglobus sp.]